MKIFYIGAALEGAGGCRSSSPLSPAGYPAGIPFYGINMFNKQKGEGHL
jgi:hypothetical protein